MTFEKTLNKTKIATNLSGQNATFVIVVAIFCISPLIAFPIIIIEILNRKRYAQTLLSLFMGFAAILWAQTGDLYRHTVEHNEFISSSSTEFIDFLSFRLDYIYYIFSYLVSKSGINFEIVRFLLVYLVYELNFYIARDIISRNSTLKKKYGIIILSFYFSTLFFALTFGLRWTEAAYFTIFGAYKLLVQARKTGYIWLIISSLFHFSLTPIAIIIIIINVFKIKTSNLVMVVFAIAVIILLSPIVLTPIIMNSPIPQSYKTLYSAYISGYWGQEVLTDHSLLYRFSRELRQLLLYPLAILVFFLPKCKMATFARIMFVYVVGCYALSFTLYERYSLIFIFSCLIIVYLSQTKISNQLIFLIFCCSLISFCSQIYTFRREFTISSEYLLAAPIPVIVNHHYSTTWINQNINSDGSGQNLKY